VDNAFLPTYLGRLPLFRVGTKTVPTLPDYKKPIEERSFADWSMGFNVVNKEKIADIKGFSDFLENPPAQPSPIHHEIVRLLTMFKNETLF